MEDVDKIVLYVGLTAAIILAGAGLYYTFAGSGMINCGTDMACLKDAAKTCTPAKVTSVSGSGNLTVKSSVKILGTSGDKCKFTLDILEAPSILGLELEGKSMTCEVPMANVESMVDFDAQSGVSDSGSCSGTLIDEFESLAANFS